ncbi:DUF1972 domain-containing protein [Shewanella cyperi]|uniref:DUF1972 domain-containing protein n=1 Tax=Shewanella cyperi TaxID=2814292 RepID=A0A975AK22_9GAMM|nr:DUF1972 domain-containing protein [Shewanella cyperi]QSX28907.1 DUF1972 domain-containing protein [Shewanella cyperi]
MKKLHVAVIGTVGLPACYGGFESLVENLVEHCSPEIFYTIYSSSKSYTHFLTEYKGAKIEYIPLSANGVQSIPYDIISLFKALFLKPDVTLILGVSGCVFLPIFRLFYRGKIVTNIDGLEWRRQKWGRFAKLFLKFSERLAVRFSDVVIADNQAITDYVKQEYELDAVTIAYGGDHVLVKGIAPNVTEKPFFLSLCRIEPENNVSMILEAFSKSSGVNLKFIGNWDRSEYGKSLKLQYSDFTNIDIIDPIYDLDELFDLRNQCVGFVHGHSAGGTNPSLVEAMHFGKPIFAFDCNFNRYSTENKALYFNSPEELNEKITFATSDDLAAISRNMKLIAENRYTWKVINQMYEVTYQ